jgi:hypothetical protein
MKKSLLAGAMAVALWGGVALADDDMDTARTDDTAVRVEGDRTVIEQPAYTTLEPVKENKESSADMRGMTFLLGGGVEGYSGALASELNPGPAWGVTAAIKPSKVLGLELGYNGAANEIDGGGANGATDGADIVRNGGQVAATIGLGAAPVQPYILGGVGVSRYNVRAEGTGFRDATDGHIPLGGGLRTHIGDFTADARVGYNVLFNNDFAATGVSDRDVAGLDTINAGRYQGMLNLGATF